MSIGKTPVPKREIIEIIIRTISKEIIRKELNIKDATVVHHRLDGFSKNKLVQLLESTSEGKSALLEAKNRYPLTKRPTLYLVSINQWPDFNILLSVTENLAKQGFTNRYLFGTDHSIRSVYMVTPAKEYQIDLPFVEIPLVYEKRIEFVESNPELEDYGEVKEIYSLENALVWYSKKFNHALLLCGDFTAIKPILTYGNINLSIKWQLPYLSEEMLNRLAYGGIPRSASFSSLENIYGDDFDAQTMTIFDQSLAESRSYQKLKDNQSRQQTSGFYSNHPDLVFGGLGISRQYGRIWTPTKLRKDTLLALSLNLIQKTEEELTKESEINLDGFISYYRNNVVKIFGKKLNHSQRLIFEELVKLIILAKRSTNQEVTIDFEIIFTLIKNIQIFDLFVGLDVNCQYCGNYLYNCPECQSVLIPIIDNENQIVFQCKNHPNQSIKNGKQIICECGEDIEITLSTDIRIFPGPDLLRSLHDFLAILENQYYDGSFLIQGNILRLIPKSRTNITQYTLDKFRFWKIRAHFHQWKSPEKLMEKYRSILFRLKEKCSYNNWHPNQQTCDLCMKEAITRKKILNGSKKSKICLPRVLGFVIDSNFDGIHHGYEVADILYEDILDETGEPIKLGIHLKSRDYPRKKGLGRSVVGVKELYTQYCYSTYLVAMGKEKLDVIGISIPNILNIDVINNFLYISHQLGIPIIILSEEDWIRIIDIAIEKAEINNDQLFFIR